VTFTVLLHPKAAKELERLDKSTRHRIREGLKELQINPEKMGKRLKPSDFWSLRIGDYRAIYEIDSSRKQVIILFIGHRSKVYDDFSKIL
jgi:mRNA interferase RelE/StbE